MRNVYYILGGEDGHEVVETTAEDWNAWHDQNEGPAVTVGQDRVGGFQISTIFVGLYRFVNNNNDANVPVPSLFETIMFKVDGNDLILPKSIATYKTWNLAVSGHRTAISAIKSSTI